MHKDEFFTQFRADIDHETLVDRVYDEMAAYCREHGISEEQVSNEELEDLSRLFVQEGFTSI